MGESVRKEIASIRKALQDKVSSRQVQTLVDAIKGMRTQITNVERAHQDLHSTLEFPSRPWSGSSKTTEPRSVSKAGDGRASRVDDGRGSIGRAASATRLDEGRAMTKLDDSRDSLADGAAVRSAAPDRSAPLLRKTWAGGVDKSATHDHITGRPLSATQGHQLPSWPWPKEKKEKQQVSAQARSQSPAGLASRNRAAGVVGGVDL